MAIEHRDIPEDGLHEPKGISVAANGAVYVSDGAGSGSWVFIEVPWSRVLNKPNVNSLTPISNPSTATTEDIAGKVNEIIAAMQSGGV